MGFFAHHSAEDSEEPWGETFEAAFMDLLSNTFLTRLTLSSLELGDSFFNKMLKLFEKRSRACSPRGAVLGKAREPFIPRSRPSPSSAVGMSLLSDLKLTYLSLSGTKLSKKSWQQLSEILRLVSNSISHLNLSNCSITKNEIKHLSDAFVLATENNLEHLDLSFNPLGSEGTSALNRAISSGRCLRELNLSNCSIDFAEICNYLKNTGCGVQSLDLSYNFITEEHANEFVSLNLFATALQSLDMSYTGLTASKAGSLLHNLLQNHNLSQPIDLNLSGNPDLSLNLRAITSELTKKANSLVLLSLDNCNLQDKGLQELFDTLTNESPDPPSFCSLSVSYNVVESEESKEREQTAASLCAFLSKFSSSLTSFVIHGGSPPGNTSSGDKNSKRTESDHSQHFRFGPTLAQALKSLTYPEREENKSLASGLQKLDVQGNGAGEEIAQVLIDVLKAQQTMKHLLCDDNRIPLGRYEELVKQARENKGMVSLSVPYLDSQLDHSSKPQSVIRLVERFNNGERTVVVKKKKSKRLQETSESLQLTTQPLLNCVLRRSDQGKARALGSLFSWRPTTTAIGGLWEMSFAHRSSCFSLWPLRETTPSMTTALSLIVFASSWRKPSTTVSKRACGASGTSGISSSRSPNCIDRPATRSRTSWASPKCGRLTGVGERGSGSR